MVSMTMRLDGTDSLMARQASIPGLLGHPDIHQDDIGQQLLGTAQRLDPVPRLARPPRSRPRPAAPSPGRGGTGRGRRPRAPGSARLAARGVHARHRSGARLEVWPAPVIETAHVGHHCTPSTPWLGPNVAAPRTAPRRSRRSWVTRRPTRPTSSTGRPRRRGSPARWSTCLGVVDLEMDHAVGPAPPTVDHARLTGVGVVEEVEVVADQLHLVERVLERHRRAGVDLLAYLDRRLAHGTEGPVGGGVAVVVRRHPSRRLRTRPRHLPRPAGRWPAPPTPARAVRSARPGGGRAARRRRSKSLSKAMSSAA